FARIVRELRPRYVLVENVAALLSRGMDVVLGDLAACGYDAEWDCIPAAAVGAYHLRDRIFIVAYAHGERHARREQQVSEFECICAVAAESDEADRAMADANSERCDDRPPLGGVQAPDHIPCSHCSRSRLGEWGVFGGDARRELAAAFQRHRTGEGIWATEPDVGRVAHGVP